MLLVVAWFPVQESSRKTFLMNFILKNGLNLGYSVKWSIRLFAKWNTCELQLSFISRSEDQTTLSGRLSGACPLVRAAPQQKAISFRRSIGLLDGSGGRLVHLLGVQIHWTPFWLGFGHWSSFRWSDQFVLVLSFRRIRPDSCSELSR